MSTLIPIRKIYRELKDVTRRVQKGEEFLVFKRMKPVFKIVPVDPEEKERFNIQDLESLEEEKENEPDTKEDQNSFNK